MSSGLHCEGIYRISGVKSKVQHLKDCYNSGETVYLEEHEPNIVAGVLKQFLRELPEPVLTNALVPKFEEASSKPISLFLIARLRVTLCGNNMPDMSDMVLFHSGQARNFY